MKRMFMGEILNTDTASLVHFWNNGKVSTDFQYCKEALYRSPTGRYFIVGHGGPQSIYAISLGRNRWAGSVSIRVVSQQAARQWLDEHYAGVKVMGLMESRCQSLAVIGKEFYGNILTKLLLAVKNLACCNFL
jgi:hypothetical protein